MLGTHPCPRLSPGPGAVLTCPGGEGGGDGGLLNVAGSEHHHVLGVGAQVAQRGRLCAGPQALLVPLGCPWRGRWRGKGGHGGTAHARPSREGVSAGPHLALGMPVGARGGERWERSAGRGWDGGQGRGTHRSARGQGGASRCTAPAQHPAETGVCRPPPTQSNRKGTHMPALSDPGRGARGGRWPSRTPVRALRALRVKASGRRNTHAASTPL